FAAARRIIRAVEAPVTVDAEGGYGMDPADLVAQLHRIGAAGVNLEDTDHALETLRAPAEHAEWPRAVGAAAWELGYQPPSNARVDVFLANRESETQLGLVPEALDRARRYAEAGVDCVYPIGLWEREALGAFLAQSPLPVGLLATPRAPSIAELAEMGAARISWATLLYREAMEQLTTRLATITRPI